MSCERGVCRLVKTKLSQTGTQEDWRFLLLKGESTIGHESNGCVSFWEILVSAQAITCASSGFTCRFSFKHYLILAFCFPLLWKNSASFSFLVNLLV
jgi:hypothetical protein